MAASSVETSSLPGISTDLEPEIIDQKAAEDPASNDEDAAEENGEAEPLSLGMDTGEALLLPSLCMNCHENGETRMLLINIPHFRELVVFSFSCPHCNFTNNEVQFAGAFAERGVHYVLSVAAGDSAVLSRQVVKSNSCTITIPELDFEIPADTQKGSITTVEGLLREAATNLRTLQEERRAAAPETAAALDVFLDRLDAAADGREAFTVQMDDPSGNSYVESPSGNPQGDALLVVTHYERTRAQSQAIGLSVAAEEAPEISPDDPHHGVAPIGAVGGRKAVARTGGVAGAGFLEKWTVPEEVMELPGSCYACGADCPTRFFQTSIPFFKDVLIMSNACDTCGYRNAEIKSGAGISERGRRMILHVEQQEDLLRDVIKAESATVAIPEIELELTTGTLGGLITTVEGLMANVAETLRNTQMGFHLGDSAKGTDAATWAKFLTKIDDCAALKHPWTLELIDPLANSFIAPLADREIDSDPRLSYEEFDRSEEQDEEFGIDELKKMKDEGLTGLSTVEEEEEPKP